MEHLLSVSVSVSDFFFVSGIQNKAKRNAWQLNFHFCPLLRKHEPHIDSLITVHVAQGGMLTFKTMP